MYIITAIVFYIISFFVSLIGAVYFNMPLTLHHLNYGIVSYLILLPTIGIMFDFYYSSSSTIVQNHLNTKNSISWLSTAFNIFIVGIILNNNIVFIVSLCGMLFCCVQIIKKPNFTLFPIHTSNFSLLYVERKSYLNLLFFFISLCILQILEISFA
jgi:hypothetical protein